MFSAALCRGLIEACYPVCATKRAKRFSAALCRGLIEAHVHLHLDIRVLDRFPRLYAAASLKRLTRGGRGPDRASFSAALCRGLIEASASAYHVLPASRFPRLYAAASLKHTYL